MMEYTHYCDEDILVGSPSVLQSAVELFAYTWEAAIAFNHRTGAL